MTQRHLAHDSPWLLGLLAAMVALGPLSVDMYLPAMPGMMEAFNTDISHMHLTLSAYLAGFALFHLACGPLADRFGRKPLLLGGTALFIAACIGCSRSTTVEELTLYRFMQGIGACVGPTLSRTITRDIFGPTRAARALSLIAMLMALAPAVAPTLGSVVLLVWPWWTIFLFLAIYGAAIALAVLLYLPESLPQRQSLHPINIARNYGHLIVDPVFLLVTLTGAMMYAGLMCYLSSSSFVYIQMLGVPQKFFGLIFLNSVLGYMAGSALSARLSSHRTSEEVVIYGTVTALLGTTLAWGFSSLLPASFLAIMLPLTFYSMGLGLVLPHTMAIALRPFPQMAGTASSLLGFIQMGSSALAAALVGGLLKDTPQPMLVSMVVISLIAVLLAVLVNSRRTA
jgi:MFS transporter, DHA1 family, multidrug resistance protein